MRSLMWFRADLRIEDNPALARATSESNEVVGLFIICPQQWRDHDWAPIKVDFILRTLAELSDALAKRNVALLIREVDDFCAVPEAIARLCSEVGCDAVYCNSEYEVNERRRDDAVESRLAEDDVAFHLSHDQVFAIPGRVRTTDDKFYKVFTPFRRALTEYLQEAGVREAITAPKLKAMACSPDSIPSVVSGFEVDSDHSEMWPAGEKHARKRLEKFIDKRIADYKDTRDLAAEDLTSRLSPYLTVGAISPHQCLRAAMEANNGVLKDGKPGVDTWISELMWREFYRHILVGFPRVSMSQPFRRETRNIKWSDNKDHLDAWKAGKTGYPIVDAGMRQLKAEGWMHNRLRMITAMFLTKDLLIDWREGEAHFMQHLIDGDLASNNGGWQWAASTGTDAAPYFRVFNPTSQSRKTDPDGEFIRRFVPELEDVEGSKIRDPPEDVREQTGYPEPIVDHAEAREAALEAFSSL